MRKCTLITTLLLLSWQVQGATLSDRLICLQESDLSKRQQCMHKLQDKAQALADIDCKKDLECWSEKYRDYAVAQCKSHFVRRAVRSSYWQQHWDDQDLDKVRWVDKGEGTLLYYEQESAVELRCYFDPNKPPSKIKVKIAARI